MAEEVLWLIEDYITIASMPKSYGTDMKFHRLDIHLIHTIGLNPGINVTELALKHGITKSAVSQAVKKLEKKDLIYRYQSPENRKEILFKVTETGTTAFEAHRKYHEEGEKVYIDQLAEFSEEEARGAEKLIRLLKVRAENIKNEVI